MDIERTIEFLVKEQARYQAQFEAEMAESRAKAQEDHARFQEELRQSRVEWEERQRRYEEESRQDIAATRQLLRRAIRAGVQEARAERNRRKEADEMLAALHAVTEQKLQQLIDSLNLPRNGQDKA